MTRICANCAANLIWDSFKKIWKCKLCGYAEENPFETDLNSPSYFG